MRYLSCCSGIGGMDLGLDRAGMECAGQIEYEPMFRAVLERHWPEVPRHDDIRTAREWWTSFDRPRIDAVVGGIPCQPFSVAGAQRGVDDPRWLWPWFRDLYLVTGARLVIVENVAGLINDPGFGVIVNDLARDGFAVEWSVVTACALGAPHARRRLFIVAHTPGVLRPSWLAEEQCLQAEAEVRRSPHGQHAWRGDPLRMAPPRVAGRVVDGSAARMVAAGGNAVVPHVAEFVGRLVMAGRA